MTATAPAAAAESDSIGQAPSSPTRSPGITWFAGFWRWHFYGAVIVIPVLFVLAVSGTIYLFRAQVDALTHPGVLTVTVPDGAERESLATQEAAVRAAFPDRPILSVVDNTGDRATAFVTGRAGDATANVYVDPYTATVTGELVPDQLVSDWAERVHGTLLIGDAGDRIIELGASWAIVLTVTGFIIFFLGRRPRGAALADGVPGAKLRTAHAIVGLPVGLGILMLVVSGLPWTGVWGSAAQDLAAGNGSSLWGEDPGAQSTIGEHLEHTDGHSGPAGWAIGNGPMVTGSDAGAPISISAAVAVAEQSGIPQPYTVLYPDGADGVFSIMSSQWNNNGNPAVADVAQETTLHVDQYTGEVLAEYGYEDYTAAAQLVSQGIAIHEGRRFGVVNTVLTTIFCAAVIFMCVSAPIMWWRRRGTASGLQAPRGKLPVFTNGILLAAMVVLGVFLPLFGISVLIVLAFDQLVIRRVSRWKKFFGSV